MSGTQGMHEAERWMQHAFGTTFHARLADEKKNDGRLNRAINDTVRILEKAKVRDLVRVWELEERRGPQGRKSYVSRYSALALLLVQMILNGKLLIDRMNHTVSMMSRRQREAIGLWDFDPEDPRSYDRIWSGIDRLQLLLDEFSDDRNARRRKRIGRNLAEGIYDKIVASREPAAVDRRRERLFQLSNALLDATFTMLPPSARDSYAGNTALDATFVALPGKIGNKTSDTNAKRRTSTPDGSWYQPHGDHEADDRSFNKKWGTELEVVSMVPNKPKERPGFPLLFLGTTHHKCGAISEVGGKLYRSLLERGYAPGAVLADLAYLPNSDPETFQRFLHENGYDLVNDLRVDQTGTQAELTDDRLIVVDSSLFPDFMPEELKNVVKVAKEEVARAKRTYRETKNGKSGEKSRRKVLPTPMELQRAKQVRNEAIAKAEAKLADGLAARENWRLKPKGRRRPNGTYQYLLPDPRHTQALDEITGEIMEPLEGKTIVIEPTLDMLKYMQKYPWGSQAWIDWYGMRSIVEGQNNFLKRSSKTDLAQPMNRLSRGVTFLAIAGALAMVAANLEKIMTFIKGLASRFPVTSKNAHQASTYWPAVDSTDLDAIPTQMGSPPFFE